MKFEDTTVRPSSCKVSQFLASGSTDPSTKTCAGVQLSAEGKPVDTGPSIVSPLMAVKISLL